MSQSLSPTRNRVRPTIARPTTARLGRGGLFAALLLHAAIVATTLFSWQHQLAITDETPPVVPVDLVTVAEKTNIAPTVKRTPKPLPKVDEPKPPQAETPPASAPTPPPQKQAEVAPAPKPEEEAPAPAPKPAAKPEKPAPPKPDKTDETQKPVPPKPAKTDVKKPKSDDINALLNKLTAPAATPRNVRTADRTVKGVGAMNAMTMDLIDALNNQIAQCWSPPVGAPHPEQLRPQFRLFLNPDGSVAQPPQLTGDSGGDGNPYMRAAVEAARRAIMTCQPYKLPADKYNIWRDITLDFDPSKMVQ